MLYSIFFISNVIISVALVAVILLHRGKGSEVGAAFSGAASSLSMFGAKGPDSFLIKVVATLAILFFANAIAMIYVAGRDFVDRSVVEQFDLEEIRKAPEFEQKEGIAEDEHGGEGMEGTQRGGESSPDEGRDMRDKQSVVPEVPN